MKHFTHEVLKVTVHTKYAVSRTLLLLASKASLNFTMEAINVIIKSG